MLASFNSVLRKTMQHISLGSISKKKKKGKEGREEKCGFTKGRSALTNLIAFCNEMTGYVDMGGAVNMIYSPQWLHTPKTPILCKIIVKTSPTIPTNHKYLSSAAETPVAAPAFQGHLFAARSWHFGESPCSGLPVLAVSCHGVFCRAA